MILHTSCLEVAKFLFMDVVGWGEWQEHGTPLQVLKVAERWVIWWWHQMEFHKVSGGQRREGCGQICSYHITS